MSIFLDGTEKVVYVGIGCIVLIVLVIGIVIGFLI